jgi:hypothetical protein
VQKSERKRGEDGRMKRQEAGVEGRSASRAAKLVQTEGTETTAPAEIEPTNWPGLTASSPSSNPTSPSKHSDDADMFEAPYAPYDPTDKSSYA